ncbi:methyl-accepting chemotaxis protein [Robbsia sp. Bb-Pol-6]|uniref:Methyl-accepting chemotaxis protein n=1 Tax=Robbsia betulipollinis TaxID=2981849 RepID=A0ABT3ZL63_9BURK|nr:methyl-accepting chemotaxis protein [Robbsia betulipollinis]MCY0387092.1 methyl-accepting chemotaxis protein [Robbsia betulipollinis]
METKNGSLKRKLHLLAAIVGLAFMAFGVWSASRERAEMVAGREVDLVHVVDLARTVLVEGQQQAASGKMTLEQAQSWVTQRIAGMHYGDDGYIFTFSHDLVMLAHPNAKLRGTDLRDARSEDGKFLFRDMLKLGEEHGQGFYRYAFPRPGAQRAQPKLTYVYYDPTWHWVVGSGIYMSDIDEAFRHALLSQAAVIVAVLAALALLIRVGTQRLLLAPLGEAVRACEAMAEGNLHLPDTPSPRGEIGVLLTALGNMRVQLAGTVRSIRIASTSISTASNEVAAGSAELAARTEAQASSLEQTVASVEQLAAAVKHNAEHSLAACALAETASASALNSTTVVSDVIATMRAIGEHSNEVGAIVGVIDGIAFQTNILALNAAVEAARAGEHGKGFAVVASEVRALAQRSSTASREIRALIARSTEQIRAGESRVDAAREAMDDTMSNIQRATALMKDVAAASSEQRAGIEQIEKAMGHIDTVTQQNAALVEESTAAAASLHEQADVLARSVNVFQLATAA